MSRSARLLHLLQVMQVRRRPVTAARLAELLEVSERTIYRDVADLVAQGAPIAGEAGVGYILRPGFFLPPLMLSRDEAEAIVLGLRYVDQRGDEVLRGAAASALGKMIAVLPPTAEAGVAQPVSLPGPDPVFLETGASISALRAAIREHVRLRIDYADEQGNRSQRIVWPVQLGFLERARVVFAWCELRSDFRTFRTDRIAATTRLDRTPLPRADLVRRLRLHLATQRS